MSNRDIRSGSYKLHELSLVNFSGETIDISYLIDNFHVIESVNSLYNVYEFVVVDAVNLLEKYVVTGNEKLKLTILKKDLPDSNEIQLEKHLILAGISDYTRPSNEGQAYRIKAISETAFASAIKEVSRSEGGSIYDVTRRLFNEVSYKTRLNALDTGTEGNFRMVLPNYTYTKTFQLLMSKAQKVDGTMFFFYETLFNDMIFTSYSEMIDRDPLDEYVQLAEDNDDPFSADTFDYNRRRIISIDSKLGASHYDGMKNGAYFSKIHSLDYSRKNYQVTDFSILNSNMPKLYPDYILDSGFTVSDKPISDYASPKEYFISENSMAYKNSDNLHNKIKTSVARRTSVLENQKAITHNIKLQGDTRLRAGECIEIRVPPSMDPDAQEGNRRDDLMSGKYLITTVMHEFDKDMNYKVIISVKRDSINRNFMRNKYSYLEG